MSNSPSSLPMGRHGAGRIAARFLSLCLLPVVAWSTGCKRPGPGKAGFPLATPEQARASMVASIAWPSVEATLGEVQKIGKRLGVPLSPEDAKAALLGRAPVPPDLVQRIDLAKPVSLILLAKRGAAAGAGDGGAGATTAAAAPPSVVLAFAAKAGPNDPKTGDATAALVAALGTPVERREDAIAVRWPAGGTDGGAPRGAAGLGETLYVLARDGAVLVADSWDSLRDGGASALAARRSEPGASGLRATLWPEGIARAAGTTLDAAVQRARDELKKERAKAAADGKPLSPLMEAYIDEVVEGMLGQLPTIETGTLGVDLTEKNGLSFTFGVRPRAGSTLAKLASEAKPYVWDPSVIAGRESPPTLAAAVGPNTFAREVMPVVLRVLAKSGLPADQQATLTAFLTSYAKDFTGEMSLAMDVASGAKGPGAGFLGYRGALKLRPGVDGKAWLARAGDLARQPWVTNLVAAAFTPEQLGGRKLAFTVKNEGDALVTRMTLSPGTSKAKGKKKGAKSPGAAGDPDAAMQAMLDMWFGAGLDAIAVADGDRIVMACCSDAKAQAARILAPGGGVASPEALARTLERTKGAWGFEHIDFVAFVRMSLSMAAADPKVASTLKPFAALLEGAAAPVYLTWSGGAELSSTMTIPIETAVWVASIVPRVMAMTQGAGGP